MSRRPLYTLPLPSSTLAALTRAGYESAEDLATSTPEELARDARISLLSSQAVFSATQELGKTQGFTQTISQLTSQASKSYTTGSRVLDDMLGEGYIPGSVLEISAPPGVRTGAIAVDIARQFIKNGDAVLFADMHNAITAQELYNMLLTNDQHLPTNLVTYTTLTSLSDVVLFMHKLPSYIESKRQKTGLLVLNSLSLNFHSLSSKMNHVGRSVIHERIRQALAHACASTGLSVLITTQLSTKLLNVDGSPTTFDDVGARAVMVPQPGSTYLPPGRSYRLMIVPRTQMTGTVQLLSSPTRPYQAGHPPISEKPYDMIEGMMT